MSTLILGVILLILSVGWMVLHPIKTIKGLMIFIAYFVSGLLGIIGMLLIIIYLWNLFDL